VSAAQPALDAGATAPPSAAMPMVEIQGVTHRYGQRLALQDIHLSAGAGEILALLGPNGSGKTTLFRILSTLMAPSEGRIIIDGLDVAGQRDEVRRRLGVVFQSPSLDQQLSAEENLRHHGHLYGLRGSELSRRIELMLRRFDLYDRRHERVHRFSGGMRRKVELAKGLLTQPRVLLLDEPSTGLDLPAREELGRLLREVRDEGIAILMTTHLMEEADRCDRVAILDQGRLVAHATPAELRRRLGGQIVTIQTDQPAAMVERLREALNIQADLVDTTVRFESPDAHRLVERVIELAPGKVQSITIGQPSLGDVFIALTGRRFDAAIEPAR